MSSQPIIAVLGGGAWGTALGTMAAPTAMRSASMRATL